MTATPISSAADRNKQPILDVLRQILPERGTALEIASGTGQHVAWFAAGLPNWHWQPTDAAVTALPAIAATVAQAGLLNVRAPLRLDVLSPRWRDKARRSSSRSMRSTAPTCCTSPPGPPAAP
jgi:methylase of polypeptide subunit release factors